MTITDQHVIDMNAKDKQRLERIRAVVSDFFRDKPPGTTIEQHELDVYHQRLRDAAREDEA